MYIGVPLKINNASATKCVVGDIDDMCMLMLMLMLMVDMKNVY
jgi:hypothetical protein